MALIDRYTKEELENMVYHCFSLKDLIKKIGYEGADGRTGDTVKRRLNHYNIDYSHFLSVRSFQEERTFENSFCENSTASMNYIRKHFLEEHTNRYECAICGISEWNGKPLTLNLDHENGNHFDNRLENLRWICPNCDRQLDSNCRKNKAYKATTRKRYYCHDCGKEVTTGSKLCCECSSKQRRVVERPNRIDLKKMIRTMSFVEIGKTFGVSDNTIRKWCKEASLPFKSSEIKSYTDDEWKNI